MKSTMKIRSKQLCASYQGRQYSFHPVLPGKIDPSCCIRPLPTTGGMSPPVLADFRRMQGRRRKPREQSGLELVEVLAERRDLLLLALALADREAEVVELAAGAERVAALHGLPVR